MKRLLLWASPALLLCIGLILSAFLSPQKISIQTNSLTEQVKNSYISDLELFLSASQKLYKLSKAEAPAGELQEAFKNCRAIYKRIEFLAEYFDGEFVKKYINGAPLPRLSTDDNKVIEGPEGMQTLEELIFSDDPQSEMAEIQRLADRLYQHAKIFLPFQKQNPVKHRFVFEASCSQIIRIFALSLTGFDTPATLDGISESAISLASVQKAVELYYPLIDKNNPELSSQLALLFEGAQIYLGENTDFDTFDRLSFLKNYLNPLYAALTDTPKLLGIPTTSEAVPGNFKYSLNPNARNIFSDDLINPFYYTELVKSQHNQNTIELGRTLFFDPILS
ncbi:MAG: hypothetical protein AAF696_20970, partial [Bacteroidota bacterium]